MISFSLQKSLQTVQGEMSLDVSCEVAEGSLATIYGPSGAGKTSILRMLAGLLNPGQGKISVGADVWLDMTGKINLPPQKRSVGIVFQDYALFPNMTVRGNLEYALPKGHGSQVVDEMIEVMELGDLGRRYPDTLSGGQKQRVALARALVRKPTLLLLDEPLSALDNEMRTRLQDHILRVHKHYGLTTVLVSHDVSEIYKMSDQIFVLDHGHIIRQGSKDDLFPKASTGGDIDMVGEIVNIQEEGAGCSVFVLVNDTVVSVNVSGHEVRGLKQGDKVLISAKVSASSLRKTSL